MFDIGFSELLLFGVIALVILGPEKLPHAARTAGKWYAKLRRTVATIQTEIEAELDLAETRQKMQEELSKIKQAEADMKREMAELKGSMKEFEAAQNNSLKSKSNPDSAPTTPKSPVHNNNLTATSPATQPWENMWFLLGDYDKARRLPPPPFMPNYRADALLNATAAPSNTLSKHIITIDSPSTDNANLTDDSQDTSFKVRS